MPTLYLDNRAIHYADRRSDYSPLTILAIHGAGGAHSLWEASYSSVSDARLIAIDLPGHGQSDPPGRRTIDHYAVVIERFASALGLENLVLVGHSMGSAIALTVAQRGIIRVEGLVLIGASARMPVANAMFTTVSSNTSEVGEYLANQAMREVPDEFRRLVSDQLISTAGATTCGDFLACNRFDLRQKLAGIATPTLVIAGRHDPMVPLRFSESLSGSLLHSRLVILEDTGHYAMLERPNEVRELTLKFIHGLNQR